MVKLSKRSHKATNHGRKGMLEYRKKGRGWGDQIHCLWRKLSQTVSIVDSDWLNGFGEKFPSPCAGTPRGVDCEIVLEGYPLLSMFCFFVNLPHFPLALYQSEWVSVSSMLVMTLIVNWGRLRRYCHGTGHNAWGWHGPQIGANSAIVFRPLLTCAYHISLTSRIEEYTPVFGGVCVPYNHK